MTSCSSNGPCSKGSCCEDNSFSSNYRKCTTNPRNCYTRDGTRDEWGYCTSNSECATSCCSRFTDECQATSVTTSCMSDGLPGWAIAIIVVFSVGFLVILISCICCCVRASRRQNARHKSPPTTSMTVVSAHHSAVPMDQNWQSGQTRNAQHYSQPSTMPIALQVQDVKYSSPQPYIPQPVVELRPPDQNALHQPVQVVNSEANRPVDIEGGEQ